MLTTNTSICQLANPSFTENRERSTYQNPLQSEIRFVCNLLERKSVFVKKTLLLTEETSETSMSNCVISVSDCQSYLCPLLVFYVYVHVSDVPKKKFKRFFGVKELWDYGTKERFFGNTRYMYVCNMPSTHEAQLALFALPLLVSVPGRGRSPVEWGEIQSIF